ncbi:MAG: type II secretion system F family protein [Desulfurivibrionaceae bacterium]|nr:type II secretion system F family protein [Desulfobulbales bacterium]MDT8335261.1 type II secretion system F family protein [Desulfurivibrionaceae bacterium]
MNVIINYFYRMLENRDFLFLQIMVFLAAALLAGSLFLLFQRRNYLTERLEKLLRGKKPVEVKNAKLFDEEAQTGFTAKILAPIRNIIAPADFSDQKKIRLRLIQAGLRSRKAYTTYLAFKVILAVIFPLTYLTFSAYYTLTPAAVTIAALLALAGFFTPNLVLLHLIRKRQQIMSRSLPDALDLMVVCVEAGLGLDMTFKRVGDELRPLNKELSDEFYLTNLEIRAGKARNESFKNMAARTGMPDIHNLMNILAQTSRLGTSVANALRIHADAMRIKRRQVAEETAAKSGVKLIFPLILFIFPAILIVLAGPAAIRIITQLFPAFGG